MKNTNSMNGQLEHTPGIDFGAVFRDGDAVADFTSCAEDVTGFIGTVAALLGREIAAEELLRCERKLRLQYLARHPFSGGTDADTSVYVTPFRLQSGAVICIKVTLLRRSSIKIQNANKKMISFELCNEAGEPITTLRKLPWFVENLRELSYALRGVLRERFPRELLGCQLTAAWIREGAQEALPCTVKLTETLDGHEISVMFRKTPLADDGTCPHVEASLLIDDEEPRMLDLLPPMLKVVDVDCLDAESFDGFVDMCGGHTAFTSAHEWASALIQRFDFLVTYQARYPGGEGILPAVLPGNVPSLLFNTGEMTTSGEAVYGLCIERQRDGRWAQVHWMLEEHLSAAGITRFPMAPDFTLEWREFDGRIPVGRPARHVLDHASRWMDPSALTGERDVFGHDIFASDSMRERAYELACSALDASIQAAIADPDSVAYGYYSTAADRVEGVVSPVSLYLPAMVTDTARNSGRPDAAFVVRLVDSETPHYEVPTMLTLDHVIRSVRVMGAKMPEWLRKAA